MSVLMLAMAVLLLTLLVVFLQRVCTNRARDETAQCAELPAAELVAEECARGGAEK